MFEFLTKLPIGLVILILIIFCLVAACAIGYLIHLVAKVGVYFETGYWPRRRN